jgi:hypothetical protein
MRDKSSHLARVLGRGAISPVAFAIIAASLGCSDSNTSPAAPQPVVVYNLGPTSGPQEGGTTVTLRLHAFPRLAEGTGFQPGAIVKFGGAAATNVSVLNDTLITAIAPSWIAAYDSALAQGKFFNPPPSAVVPNHYMFNVTVSPAGQKTNANVLVGSYTYVDTTLRFAPCDSDCWEYQRVRSKVSRGSSHDRTP